MKCFYCGKEQEYHDKQMHRECFLKQDKLYAANKLLEMKVITFEEYLIMISDMTGLSFIENYRNRKCSI